MTADYKLIYISYYFPPIHSIAVLRNFHLAEQFAKKVKYIQVFSTSNYKYFEKSYKDLKNLNVRFLKTIDYRTISRIFRKDKKQFHYSATTKKNTIIRFFIKLNETLPFSLILGEGGLIYILSAVVNANKLIKNTDGRCVVFTPYRPTANIVAGYIIKLFNPQVFWTISMHDLPYLHKRPNTLFKHLHIYFWKLLLKKADLVTTLSTGLAKNLSHYGIDAPVIQNGILPRKPTYYQNPKFTISFTGSLYDGLISPIPLFEALESLITHQKINIHELNISYAGKDGSEWISMADAFANVKHVVTNHGLITHESALELQTYAHINLLLTWNDDHVNGILTGKVFEYLGATLPILTIVDGHKDTVIEDLIHGYNNGDIFYTTAPGFIKDIEDYVLSKYLIWKNKNYDQCLTSYDRLEDLSWTKQANLMWRYIESISI